MTLRRWIALALGLTGVIFILQGLGLTQSVPSLMNNDVRWTLIGIGQIIISLFLWGSKVKSDNKK